MSLIDCPACGKNVSSAAAACIGCGHPFKSQPGVVVPKEDGRYVTTQGTAKSLKMQQILSALAIVIGFAVMSTSYSSDPSGEPGVVGPSLVLIGILWFVVTRFRIWWHHK